MVAARCQSLGFSLLEVIVALGIASMLFGLMFTYFELSTKLSKAIHTKAKQLENNRFALFFIYKTLKQATVLPSSTDEIAFQFKTTGGTKRGCFFVHNHSLCYKEEGRQGITLASQVDAMQVSYGIRCPGSSDVCGYLRSSAVTVWSQVRIVRVLLQPSRGSIYVASALQAGS